MAMVKIALQLLDNWTKMVISTSVCRIKTRLKTNVAQLQSFLSYYGSKMYIYIQYNVVTNAAWCNSAFNYGAILYLLSVFLHGPIQCAHLSMASQQYCINLWCNAAFTCSKKQLTARLDVV